MRRISNDLRALWCCSTNLSHTTCCNRRFLSYFIWFFLIFLFFLHLTFSIRAHKQKKHSKMSFETIFKFSSSFAFHRLFWLIRIFRLTKLKKKRKEKGIINNCISRRIASFIPIQIKIKKKKKKKKKKKTFSLVFYIFQTCILFRFLSVFDDVHTQITRRWRPLFNRFFWKIIIFNLFYF